MNITEYNNKLKQLIGEKSGQLALSIRIPAANRMLATIKNRIINEGKSSTGADIGQYSRKPAYFSRDKFVKKGAFKGQGQRGFTGERIVESKGKTGRISYRIKKTKPKTMYLPEGYAQFRAIQGRENNKVNLNLSGSMMNDYQQQAKGTKIYQGFTNKKESDKRKGNEANFNKKIFPASQKEIADYNKEVATEYGNLVIKVLRG